LTAISGSRRFLIAISVLAAAVVFAAAAPQERYCPPGTITTIAGTGGGVYQGPGQYPGDGGPALDARISEPCDLLLMPGGRLLIADRDAHRIRQVDLGTDIITTVAGTGREGYSGDGGPATKADLKYPMGLALAPDGGFYIADNGNHRIRRVSAEGIITTIAGDGWTNETFRGRFAGDGGPAIRASLYSPQGLAVGPDGSLYVADRGNRRIRKIAPDGMITTVAGSGDISPLKDNGLATESGLNQPMRVALGPDGSLYIADASHDRIRKVDLQTGVITTVAGGGRYGEPGDGGPATAAYINLPCGLAVDANGNLYIADCGDSRVRKVDREGKISTVAGNGTRAFAGDEGLATEANLSAPSAVAVDADGSLYIADGADRRIRLVCGKHR
jgi:DNA-binding beta-propeller fold protein YncE